MDYWMCSVKRIQKDTVVSNILGGYLYLVSVNATLGPNIQKLHEWIDCIGIDLTWMQGKMAGMVGVDSYSPQ